MRALLWIIVGTILLSALALAADLNCSITTSAGCTETAVLYLENDTGGYNNAQAQNVSVGTYSYVVCCDADAVGDTITTDCTDYTFLLLSALTNAHVQQTPVGTYPIEACISATAGDVSCVYSTSCTATQDCLVSMASDGASNTTNAHVGNCSNYETKVCCGISSPPPAPILYKPEDGNVTLHDRTPLFIWFNSTDPDNDVVNYNMWVDDTKSFASPVIEGVGIKEGDMYGNATNYSNTTALNVDTIYYWKVEACDSNGMCTNSTRFNFTVESYADITLTTGSVAFGLMSPGESNNTLDWQPSPMVAENTGNIRLDVNVTAQNMFTAKPNPDIYFQYMIAENETNSYQSAMSWQWFNLNQTVYNTTVTQLNWSDSADTFNFHIRVEVPNGEPPVPRLVNLTFTAG